MKKYKVRLFNSFLLCAVFAVVISGCSDESTNQSAQSTAASSIGQSAAGTETIISKDSPHDATPEAEDSQKKSFEQQFAEQCVERELNNSENKIEDAERANKACSCIAAYIMKDLTDEEAEKFLNEHEQPQSLRIKYEAAAYECLQEKAKVPGPKIFGKPQ